jgi:phosphoglycerol transferase
MSSFTRRLLLLFGGYFAGCFGIALARWIGGSFGETSLDQILWHLRYTEHAAVQMGGLFLFEFTFEVLLFPAVAALLLALVHVAVAERLHGTPRRLLRAGPPAVLAGAVVALLAQFSVFSYVQSQFGPDRFAEAYVDPAGVRLHAQPHKRNLVLVYAESLEQTYGDARLFGRDLLAPLHALGGVSFTDYHPMPGATWTMAAMVATQCGVPLKVYSEAPVRAKAGRKSFLPGATCLGDVLQAHGWHNVFLGGAPLSFAGKGAFLRDHGYADTRGRDEWERAGLAPAELNEWGLVDSALFARAHTTLRALQAAGKPFNLTLLTIDTHNPHGFQSPYCRGQGARDFQGIVGCSAGQIAGFISEARQAGELKDTIVVVLGDHLAFPNPAWEQLQKAGDSRRMFDLFFGDGLAAPNTTELLPFDLYPSILALLGLPPAGERLALGYTAFGPAPAGRPAHRAAAWSLAAVRGSATYDRLWQADVPAGSPD